MAIEKEVVIPTEGIPPDLHWKQRKFYRILSALQSGKV
jgi:hypothetical protein